MRVLSGRAAFEINDEDRRCGWTLLARYENKWGTQSQGRRSWKLRSWSNSLNLKQR
jgi:hypothetical protein